jgi:hypothetical protein
LAGWASTLWLLAPPGRSLPSREALEQALLGFRRRPISTVERLLTAREGPLNGSGSMRPAFFELSDDWPQDLGGMDAQARRTLLAQRDGELRALVDWVRHGAPRQAYERDEYALSPDAAADELGARFVVDTPSPPGVVPRPRVRIASLIAARCVRCHREDGPHDKARWFPLDTYERLQPYVVPPPADKPGWTLLAWLGLLPVAVGAALIHRLAYPTGRLRLLRNLPMLVHLGAVAMWWVAVPDAGQAVWLYAVGWLVAAGAACLLADTARTMH